LAETGDGAGSEHNSRCASRAALSYGGLLRRVSAFAQSARGTADFKP